MYYLEWAAVWISGLKFYGEESIHDVSHALLGGKVRKRPERTTEHHNAILIEGELHRVWYLGKRQTDILGIYDCVPACA